MTSLTPKDGGEAATTKRAVVDCKHTWDNSTRITMIAWPKHIISRRCKGCGHSEVYVRFAKAETPSSLPSVPSEDKGEE